MRLTPQRWDWDERARADQARRDEAGAHPVVWLTSRIENPDAQRDLLAVLSPDERARHERLRRREDQQRFLTGRGLLRLVLGEHLNIPAESVTFAYGRFGKPSLAQTHGAAPLHFNVSHSGDLVLLAFSGTHDVGVDVEQFRPESEWREVAGRMFSDPDYAAWLRRSDEERAEWFFQAWTRREAALKATGLGLIANQTPGTSSRQRLFDLDLPAGYAGAVAMLHPRLGLEGSIAMSRSGH